MEKQNWVAFFAVPKSSDIETSERHKEFVKIRSSDSNDGWLTLIDSKRDLIPRSSHIKKIIKDSIGGLN